jgi:hypothetical protein
LLARLPQARIHLGCLGHIAPSLEADLRQRECN